MYNCITRFYNWGSKDWQTMAKVFPCESIGYRAPALYTYYAIMSLLVIFLAVTLIWLPFLQLITEFSTVVSKVITYLDANFLEHDGDCVFETLASLLIDEKFLMVVSGISLGFIIFLASGDFLMFAACYIYNLPNVEGLETIKEIILKLILLLLYLTKSKYVHFVPREELEEPNPERSSVNNVKQSKNLLALL